jgi:hypothetical protein
MVMTSPFGNDSHLQTTQCACADFSTQRKGGGGREKELYLHETSHASMSQTLNKFLFIIRHKYRPFYAGIT